MDVITLENLKHTMCKWPIGDPKHDNFHFCGDRREAGQSYCAHHTDLAYRTHSGGQTFKNKEEDKKAA
jgi:GcrA cell cycle regulator